MLGLTLYPTGLGYRDAAALAGRAEDSGFGGIFFVELRGDNDALAAAQAAAAASRHIKVGTNIANVYLRQPGLLAAQAIAVDELSDGRLILGIGTSNRRVVEAIGLTWHPPIARMRETTRTLRAVFAGESAAGVARPRPAAHAIPIHWAAVALATVEAAGVEADGLMLFLATPQRIAAAIARFHQGTTAAAHSGPAQPVSLLTPVFLSEDMDAAHAAARRYLSHYLLNPIYQRMFAEAGFAADVDALRAAAPTDSASAQAFISEAMSDAVALIGPVSRCKERLAAFREAGIDDPLLSPQVIVGDIRTAAEAVIDAFGPA